MKEKYAEKRSMRVAGHRTSLALEPEFWRELECCAERSKLSIPVLVANIDKARQPHQSLASAVRCHVLEETINLI